MMLLPLDACPPHIFVGSLVDLPVALSAVETALTCSRHPFTLTTAVRSTLSLHHQCQLCTALCGFSRSHADSSTGPWDCCYLCTLSLHLSVALIPSTAHPSLLGVFVQDKTLCQGVGGQAMNPRLFASTAQL